MLLKPLSQKFMEQNRNKFDYGLVIGVLAKFGVKANPTKNNSTNLVVKVAKSKHMTKTCTAFNLKNLKNSSWVNLLDIIKREVGYYRDKKEEMWNV